MAEGTKTALITGASSGIGEALAWLFAREGYDLVLVARSAAKLDSLAAELGSQFGVQVRARPCDLSKSGSTARLARSLQDEEVPIDVLVNNAGVLEHGEFVEMSPADHQRMIRLNIAGMTDILAHFLPPMVNQGRGRVLNVASIAGFMPIPSLATYAATKAYVLSLSEALLEELRGSGVTVTALCPGVTKTGMVTRIQDHNARTAKLPSMMISDVELVAQIGFDACMRGDPIVVPGMVNRAAALGARAMPKWLLRRLTGLAGRASFAPD